MRGALGAALARFARPPRLLEPHAPHRRPQSRGAGRPRLRHPLSQPVPRRPDRRAGREPPDPGRDHRRGDRRIGDRRRPTRSPSIPTSCSTSRPGRALSPADGGFDSLEFPINPERVAPILRRLISPTRTRARIYDRDGIADRRFAPSLFARPDPPLRPAAAGTGGAVAASSGRGGRSITGCRARDLPIYQELGGANGKGYPEVGAALAGVVELDRARHRPGRADRLGRRADPALSRRPRRAAAVDRRAATSTRSSMPSGWRSSASSWSPAAVTVLLSILLAGTIAAPLRRLAEAADRVRRGVKSRPADPRLQQPPRRDRPSVAGAPRHDQRALQPHRGDRELRRRRRARAEEPADLAAQRRRDAAARQDAGGQGPADRRSSSTTSAGSTG